MKLQIDIYFTENRLVAILRYITLNFPCLITEFHIIFTLLFLNSEWRQCLFLYFVKDL